MAEPHLHAATELQNSPRRSPGPITAGLLKWTCNGPSGPTPFGGSSGADAASMILLKAHALTACLSAAFSDSATIDRYRGGEDCSEFDTMIDSTKSLALDAIGDLIMLAKVLVDEE